MTKFFDFIKSALALFILVTFIAFIMFFFTLGALQVWQERNRDHVAPEWVKKAHKRHGIAMSYEERGKHYFYRNGERCKL